MIIRDALEPELELIRKQRLDAYREHESLVPASHWNALERAISSEADVNPDVRLLVAETADGKIAGSIALFPAESDAYEGKTDQAGYPEIRMLAVDPAYRGHGAASALIAECVKLAKESGAGSVGLHTGEFMSEAIRLYGKLGFERAPEYDFQPLDDGITVIAFRLFFK